MNDKYLLPSLLIAVGIALSGFFVGNALYKAKKSERYVSVKGFAEKVVKANQATWVIAFNYASDDLIDLYKGIAKSQETVRSFFVDEGFDATSIIKDPINITDNQSTGYNGNTNAKRYSANGSVSMTTNKVDAVQSSSQKTGNLLEKGVVINMSNIQYQFTELNTLKPPMLDEATANAREAAKSFARNAQSEIGDIRMANQGLFTISAPTGEGGGEGSVMKKVRVVTTVEYLLR